MSERTKRLLIVIGFILSVIVIAYAIWAAFFRATPQTPAPEAPQAQAPTGGALTPSQTGRTPGAGEITPGGQALPSAAEVAGGGITKTTELTTAPVADATLSGDGSGVNFYNDSDGKFYRIDATGNVTTLSNKEFPSVENVAWNKDAQKAVLEFPDGSNVVYDFDNETQVTLPQHWKDFEFSPTSDQIAAKSIGLDPNNRWLVTTNADGSNVRSIQELGDNETKVQVNWSPNDQIVAFSDTAEGQGSIDRKMIIPIGKEHENFKGLIVEGLGFQSQWSPDGKRLLYSVSGSYSNYRPLLWIVDGTSASMGDHRKSLSINTWVDKCAWAGIATVYCAVPQGLPPNAGLQPKAFGTFPDAIYRIDVDSGSSALVAIPNGEKTLSKLFVTNDQSVLYFTNLQTGNLESLKLK
ncbi:hypothetical protein HZA85_00655 [Candidatus Uhrbacteria bacterium]|nr:hypothetical protein [Candidatus Uhrbacteria bacterium]